MLNSLRQRTGDEGGFTLIELLVVVLIIGILSAIAIPAFLSQTSKASDSAAKTQVGTLQTTMQTYAAENNGSYLSASLTKLQEIEPTLKDVTTAKAALVGAPTATEFTVESEAIGSKNTYTLKNKEGEITRSCKTASTTTPANTGGGCKGGSW
jgi:type IV pilus assembly protein PilA